MFQFLICFLLLFSFGNSYSPLSSNHIQYIVKAVSPIRSSFSPPSQGTRATATNTLKATPSPEGFVSMLDKKISALLSTDKESNRKFRRTVFTKKDWVNHRSSNRYFRELRNMHNSLILRGLGAQTLAVTLSSFIMVAYNTLIERNYFPKWLPFPLLSFPPLPFMLISSALGLLLVFRTSKLDFSSRYILLFLILIKIRL